MSDFPITVGGQVFDLMVTCDRGVFCRLEDWPQTLPGQLAARERRIAELEAEIAALRTTTTTTPAPAETPAGLYRCPHCEALWPPGFKAKRHEQTCPRNPNRRAPGPETAAIAHAALLADRRICPGCGVAFQKNNWGRHTKRCSPGATWDAAARAEENASPKAEARS